MEAMEEAEEFKAKVDFNLKKYFSKYFPFFKYDNESLISNNQLRLRLKAFWPTQFYRNFLALELF